jgi:hypothetical protein
VAGFGPHQLRELARWSRSGGARPEGHSGYFESAADTCFRTLDDGRRVFYPHGPFGRRGYVIEKRRDEDALRERVKAELVLTAIASPFLAGLYGSFLRDMGVLHFLLLMAGLYVASWIATELLCWPLTRRLERAAVPNSPTAAWRRMGRTVHPGWVILGAGFLLAISAAGFLLYACERQATGLLIGFACLLGASPYGIAIRAWWRQRAGEEELGATWVDSTDARR